MSRKNFKVDTATNGQTPKQDTKHLFVVEKTNVPTGKVITKEDREKRRKAREEQYKNFRIGALKRRAKRMGLTEEQTEEKVKLLIKQLEDTNDYTVLLMFNPNNAALVYAALDKENIICKLRCPVNAKESQNSFCWIDADQETLGTIREIVPPGTMIHPYVKRKPPVLEAKKPNVEKKPSNNNKTIAHNAKIARKIANKTGKKNLYKFKKRVNVAALSKVKRLEFKKQVKALKASWKAEKKASGTTVPMKAKNGSKSLKKASTLKKAA